METNTSISFWLGRGLKETKTLADIKAGLWGGFYLLSQLVEISSW